MASSTTTSCVFVLSLLFLSAFASACGKCKPSPTPKTPTTPTPAAGGKSCPIDTLKLGVCADVLGLVNVVVGEPASGSKCCAVLEGLVDLEAALCLCTAIKANVLGINLNVPITLGLLVSACEKTLPKGFKCPS